MRAPKTDTRNLVAKHARSYNTAVRFEDRKKALKRGKVKQGIRIS